MTTQQPWRAVGLARSRAGRAAYMALGWVSVGLAIVGAVLPVMPTTPFLIVAAWAFARGSRRMAAWLYGHRIFGPMLTRWDAHRVIPLWAKIFASAAMSVSLTWLALGVQVVWWAWAATAALMALGAAYIWSKPSRPPAISGASRAGRASIT